MTIALRRILLCSLLAAAGVLSAVAIAACGDDDEETAASDEEIQIRITDTALDPDRVEVQPGTIRFRIDNDSEHVHQLEIETQNGTERSEEIPAGDSGSVTVELDEGEYRMYDPLENYRERGVAGVIVVSEQTETVTEEETDTVTERETDTDTVTEEETVTERETDTVTEERTVTQQQTVTQEQDPSAAP